MEGAERAEILLVGEGKNNGRRSPGNAFALFQHAKGLSPKKKLIKGAKNNTQSVRQLLGGKRPLADLEKKDCPVQKEGGKGERGRKGSYSFLKEGS